MENKKCSLCGYKTNKPNILKKHIKFHHKNELKTEKEIEHKFIFDFYGKTESDIINLIFDYNSGISITDLTIKHKPLKTDGITNLLKVNGVNKRTISETRHTEYYKNKYTKTLLKNYGVDNPSKNNEIKKRKVETMLLNWGRINNFSDPKIKKKAFEKVDFKSLSEKNQKKAMELYGVKNFMLTPNAIENNKRSRKKYLDSLSVEEKRKITEIARKQIKHKSKLETRIQTILNDLSIEYSANCFIFGYNYDLVFKNKKIIIEVQGDYWHCNPKKYKADDIVIGGKNVSEIWKKDEKKKKIAEKNKYKLIAIWESDMNKMSDEILKNFLIKNLI